MPARTKRQKRLSPETRYIMRQVLVGLALLAVGALLFAAVWYGTRIERLTIAEVAVVGGVTIDHEAVRAAAQGELEGAYFRVVPRRFAWLYPEEAVVAAVAQIERVREVRLERQGTTLAVAFDEYVPFALWCEAPAADTCLFIDQTGYAFATAPPLTGGSFVRYVTTSRPPAVGTQGVARDVLAQTSTFTETLEAELGLFVTHVEVDQVGDVFYSLARGGELKVSLRESTAETIDNLAAVLRSPEFAHLEPGNFQYIDLRFGNKVFVNETGAPELGTSTASSSDAGDTME